MKYLLARAAYEGYRAHTKGKSITTGLPIPEWDDMPDNIKDAWVAAITAVRELLCCEVKREIEDAGLTIYERLLR